MEIDAKSKDVKKVRFVDRKEVVESNVKVSWAAMNEQQWIYFERVMVTISLKKHTLNNNVMFASSNEADNFLQDQFWFAWKKLEYLNVFDSSDEVNEVSKSKISIAHQRPHKGPFKQYVTHFLGTFQTPSRMGQLFFF